ncbi:MAG: trigger factor [Clostridia bacterium]|nr:trigger factor [Clostridia bacterium]MBR2742213.1 trigger factor [Clostridia bacterium]
MNKKLKVMGLVLAGAMLAGLFTGCQSAKDEKVIGDDGTINYGAGLNDDGTIKGVKALDYVTLPDDYNAINVPAENYVISDDVIDYNVEYLMSGYTEDVDVLDRAVADGDTINIDYTGYLDGVAFDRGAAADQRVTIGVTSFIPGFLEQIIGHTPGEEFDINVTFPEEYPNDPDMAGKDAVFHIKLNSIIEQRTPELTDDFVAINFSNYGWTSIEDMRTKMKADMEKASIQNYINDYLMENSTVSEVPQSLLDYQGDLMTAYYMNSAESYGMEFEEFLSSYLGVESVEEMKENQADTLKQQAEYNLVIQAVAEKDGISATDEAVSNYFEENSLTTNYQEIEDTYGKRYIKMAVLNELVLEHLADTAVLG